MLTAAPRCLNRLLEQLRSRDALARPFTTNSLVGVMNERNIARIVSAPAQALVAEKSEWVRWAIGGDLEEVVSRAVGWKAS